MKSTRYFYYGLALTAILSFIVLTVFYGNLYNCLNKVSFASGGDGLQSIVNMNYHIRYDTSYMRCNSMNYPYGEHEFFVNNQPLISNPVKFISQHFIDISGYSLGIINFLMLFCLVITPLFIYLIFSELGVGRIVSVIASVGITYLSPQLDRFGGHFTLSYVCSIPLMIYLLMRFFKKPGVCLSGLISLAVFVGALTHFYLYGFDAILILFFYAGYGLTREKIFNRKFTWIIHLFFQLLVPFLILQFFYIADHVTDRPSYPWGFLYYRAYPQSIFLPFGKPYGHFLYKIVNVNFIDWEGYAFVGLVASVAFFIFLIKSIRHLIINKFRQILQPSENQQLNVLFWASFTALLYSFGLPYIMGLEWLIDLVGPIRQMRGIARFSWIFFYVMNICAFYWLWLIYAKAVKKIIPLILLILALLMLSYDAYYNVHNRGKWLENYIPELTDVKNTLPSDQWINRVNCSNFQAIIPLPYFHVGSEDIWIDGGCDIVKSSFLALNNSGLPCLGVMLSRTSINQTIDNVSLMSEPGPASYNMSRFPSGKPFLLMVAKNCVLNDYYKLLINRSKWIDSSMAYNLYNLPFNAFRSIYDSLSGEAVKEFRILKLFDSGKIRSADSVINYIYCGFDSIPNPSAKYGTGCFEGKARNKNIIFSGIIPNADTSCVFTASFWLSDIRQDLYARTRIEVTETDVQDKIVKSQAYQAFQKLTQFDGNWVLIELEFKITRPDDKITISLQNVTLRNKLIQVDELLIKPERINVYWSCRGGIMKNNRFYKE